MSHGFLAGVVKDSVPLSGKRIRQPSQYSDNIRKLNEEQNKRPRRQKSARNPSQHPSSNSSQQKCICVATLKCVLPSSQPLRVSIMLRKSNSSRTRTVRKQKSKKKPEVTAHQAPVVEQEDLAEKFLNALQKLDSQRSKQHSVSQSERNQMVCSGSLRESSLRLEKDVNNKFLRLYERAEQLIHCFESSTLVEI